MWPESPAGSRDLPAPGMDIGGAWNRRSRPTLRFADPELERTYQLGAAVCATEFRLGPLIAALLSRRSATPRTWPRDCGPTPSRPGGDRRAHRCAHSGPGTSSATRDAPAQGNGSTRSSSASWWAWTRISRTRTDREPGSRAIPAVGGPPWGYHPRHARAWLALTVGRRGPGRPPGSPRAGSRRADDHLPARGGLRQPRSDARANRRADHLRHTRRA